MAIIDINNLSKALDSFYSKIKNNFAPKNHGTHLTLGVSSATAFRGDYGNTAYNHSQAPHAPSNAQKNSDITKAEIEAKLTGNSITSHRHEIVTGVYTSNGGAQPPSYISGGTVKFNMMNKFKGLTGLPTYADCILMDTYTGLDVPYVTGFGILKTSGNPRAFIAVGTKGNTTTWSSETELLTVANYKTHVTPANIGAAASHNHDSYVNQNAFSNFTVGSTTISADSTTDTLTIVAGSNITLTPDATNDKLTIAATNTTYSTGNASTAGLTKLYTGTGTATDGTMTQAAINTAINAAITSMSGNAGTATKLATARKINGTLFDGSADITTANWGTTRNITISDSVGVNTGTAVSVNGSVNVNLKLPATISASLSGNATTATTLATARTINGTSFNGAGNITTANWGTARTITIGGSSKSVNGSANVSWTLAEIGAAKESHGTHVSYGGNGSAATVSRSDHTHKYAGSSSAGGTANSVNGFTFWSGTQSQYDSIATKSSTTVYMITG